MKLMTASKLARQYAECPECGSTLVGNGHGKLIIEDDTFYRSCKCGWEVTVKDGDSDNA